MQYVGPGACSHPGCCGSPEDEQAFAYTVGLHDLHHPELLLFGCSYQLSVEVLNDVAAVVANGHQLAPGQVLDSTWGFRLAVEQVPNPEEILFMANDHYRLRPPRSVAALQLSYDDLLGRLPWQDGCRTRADQPRPGTFRA